MMGTLWEQDGVLIEEGGSLVECDDCPCAFDCSWCDSGTVPEQLQLTFESGTWQQEFGSDCATCSALNSSYLLDLVSAETGACTWVNTTATACGTLQLTVYMAIDNPGTPSAAMEVYLQITLDGHGAGADPTGSGLNLIYHILETFAETDCQILWDDEAFETIAFFGSLGNSDAPCVPLGGGGATLVIP